ncbi:hypothetical protein LOD59_11990, partial [Xylella fastidiosa subsp. multiplex]|nr:hypothetical protein [Xylella fastidiosa subsp. multiplex]
MRYLNVDFREAVRQLDSGALPQAEQQTQRQRPEYVPDMVWVPCCQCRKMRWSGQSRILETPHGFLKQTLYLVRGRAEIKSDRA